MVEICKLKPGASVKDVVGRSDFGKQVRLLNQPLLSFQLETLSKASEFLDATRMNMGDKSELCMIRPVSKRRLTPPFSHPQRLEQETGLAFSDQGKSERTG